MITSRNIRDLAVRFETPTYVTVSDIVTTYLTITEDNGIAHRITRPKKDDWANVQEGDRVLVLKTNYMGTGNNEGISYSSLVIQDETEPTVPERVTMTVRRTKTVEVIEEEQVRVENMSPRELENLSPGQMEIAMFEFRELYLSQVRMRMSEEYVTPIEVASAFLKEEDEVGSKIEKKSAFSDHAHRNPAAKSVYSYVSGKADGMFSVQMKFITTEGKKKQVHFGEFEDEDEAGIMADWARHIAKRELSQEKKLPLNLEEYDGYFSKAHLKAAKFKASCEAREQFVIDKLSIFL